MCPSVSTLNRKKNMKNILVIGYAVVASIFGLAACIEPGQETKDSTVVENQQKIYAATQPIPVFKWSQDRDNLIQIYTLKVTASRATHSVVRSNGTGEVLWHCESIGFPIPADTQLTNPLQAQYQGTVIEQAEPNGLFTGKNTDATYVLCVDSHGAVSPQYTEAKVEAFSRPIDVVNGKVVFLDGPASMKILKHGGPPSQ